MMEIASTAKPLEPRTTPWSRRRTEVVAFVLVALGAMVLASPPAPAQGPTDPAAPELNQGPKETATASGGMVSTELASSTLAALDVLEQGGNAVDAAVTAMFVQQVHDYHMVFLFGSMSALYYDAESGRTFAINAVAQRPSQYAEGPGDASKVAVGGTVRGTWELHERFGSRPWRGLVEPAVAAAEEGAIVTSYMYGFNFSLFESGFLSDLRDHPEARAFYMPEGHLVGVGRRWKMPALAETLRRISEDPHYMYSGAWGEKFVAAARENGGKVSLQDLAGYRAEWTEPVAFDYRGNRLLGSPPPDTGGLQIGVGLRMLEQFELAKLGPHWQSAEALEILARVLARAEWETDAAVRDPLDYRIPTEVLLSDDYARLGAEIVRQSMPATDLGPPPKASGDDPTASAGAAEAGPIVASSSQGGGLVELGSDHLVIVDRHGNWLTMLHTIHGGAPGVFVDGVRATGSQGWASTVGPGRRLVLPISAILILDEEDRPWLAMGTPGNPPQPVTQVLVNILDHGMDPRAATDAPRFWAFRPQEGSNAPDTLDIEGRLDDDLENAMASRGIVLHDIGAYNYHTGSMQIVWRDEEGTLHGVTDARRLGYTAGHD